LKKRLSISGFRVNRHFKELVIHPYLTKPLRKGRIRNGLIIANYLGRRPEEPLSAPPTVDMRMILTVENDRIKKL
jgi:hypothetical protein